MLLELQHHYLSQCQGLGLLHLYHIHSTLQLEPDLMNLDPFAEIASFQCAKAVGETNCWQRKLGDMPSQGLVLLVPC